MITAPFDPAPPFELVWPDVERRLRALLYRRGLDAASAEDVVQEVALRALAGRVTYTSAKDLLRWAAPVACNLHVDLLRQRAWLEHEVDAERPCTADVAREVADRLELQRALRGIAQLRPDDRAAIIDAVRDDSATPARTRKESVRLAVRRHRARSRLALVMEQLAAWVVGWRWLRRPRAAAVVLVPVAAFPLLLTSPHHEPVAPRTVTPVAAAPAAAHPTREVRAAVRRAHPAPAPAAGRAAPAARPAAPDEPAPPTQPPALDVRTDDGIGVRARGDDRRPDDRTVCVRRVPIVGDVCAG